MRKLIFFGVLLFLPFATLAQNYTISGYIKDSESGEVLIGANIFNAKKKNGAATNNFGFFSYTTPADSVDLFVTYIGYSVKRIRMKLDKNIELVIKLDSGEMLDEIVVTGEQNIEETTQMSQVTIPIALIKTMPSLLGEVDVLKALQMVPGVQSGSEGSSGLYVRGGGPDQNLILLDGVPLYNASHLFGFFSVFNADAINNVELTKGGFPARYGGRLSSVVDITMKEGNEEKINAQGSIGLISSKLTLDGPINKKTTFLLSGRRTYIDILARPLIKNQSDGKEVAGYYFYDLNTKINHRFSERDRIYLSGYFGDDKAYYHSKDNYSEYVNMGGVTKLYEYNSNEDFGLEWGNLIAALRWTHIYTPKLFGNVTLTRSRYQFDTNTEYFEQNFENEEEIYRDEYKARYYSQIKDWAGKIDFQYLPNPNLTFRTGASVTQHLFEPGVLAYRENTDIDTTLGAKKTYSNDFYVFGEVDTKITSSLSLNAGLHYSAFDVEDQFYLSLQPRVGFSLNIPGKFSLKGAYTKMTQYLHLLSNSGIGLPTDLWVPATSRVKPQQAHQIAIGLAKKIKDLDFTLEGYYKKMDNLIEYAEGANYLEVEKNWENKIVVGWGESYGAELFVQKKYGRWNGWVGYTLAWNFRQFDDVNFGERFPYKYDRRHDINIVASYKPRKGVQYSFGWVYGTGNAVSIPIRHYRVINDYGNWNVNYYGGRNQQRMAAYHRLDVNASWTKPKRWGERTWSLGLYNAYSRRNPFFIDLESSSTWNSSTESYENDRRFVQYSLFPLIPSITYSFKF